MIERYIKKTFLTSVEKEGKIVELIISNDSPNEKNLRNKYGKNCKIELSVIEEPYTVVTDENVGDRFGRRVFYRRTGQIFSSVRECSKRTGINVCELLVTLNKKVNDNNADFMYIS